MKRSEAIEEMESTWREYTRDLLSEDFSGIRNGMSLVLYKLEALGMVPPNQYACTNEFRFEWEDEDEEK